jgi:RalA-binding protein 1
MPEPQRLGSGNTRDFLPQHRSSPQFSRPVDGRLTHRKPTPSPLQASETPTSSVIGQLQNRPHSPHSPRSPTTLRTASGSQYSHSPRSPRLNFTADPSSPKSPRDRLDELLASEAAATGDVAGSIHERGDRKAVTPASPKTQSYSQLRNVSSPLPQGKSADISPPHSPLSTASTNFSDTTMRPDARSFPRTSSIDSAISTISTATSNSHKSSQDSGRPTTPDISSLINAAGSAEAVVHHLLKEKQHVAAQNAQLWKLVDKQRALVLGLNQDLERALKDKERYRKKLRENLTQVPPLPDKPAQGPTSVPIGAGSFPETTKSRDRPDIQGNIMHEPATSEALTAESGLHNMMHPPRATKPREDSDAAAITESAEQVPADKKHSPIFGFGKAVPPLKTSDLRGPRPNVLLQESPQNANAVVSPSSFTAKRSNNLQKSVGGPAFALTESTPISAADQSSLPFRKLPPAPLDLHKPKPDASNPSDFGPADHSDSDYDENILVDELPTFERGRKKTREDDDNEREVAAVKQQLERSQSKKEKGSKTPSGSAPPSKTAVIPIESEQNPMPIGIKGLSPHPTSGGEHSFLSPPNSLAGVLSHPIKQQRRSSSEGKIIMSAPLSPGLPSSPRPGDRPINPPTPRLPRDLKTASILSAPNSARNGLPLSPRAPTHSIPLSPRAPRQPIPLPPHTPSSISSPMSQDPELQPEPLVAVKRPASPPQANSPPASPTSQAIRAAKSTPPPSLPLLNPPPFRPPPTQPSSPNVDSEAHPKPTRREFPEDWRPEGVYKGLLSDAYPHVLIPPNALPSIRVKVMSSRLKPSRHSYTGPKGIDEEPVFTLGVSARSNMQELWQVEKSVLSLPPLDNQMKEASVFSVKLPDRSLFNGHAPAKIDARRVALEAYFEAILDTPMDERAALIICRYLSTQVIESRAENPAGTNLAPEAGSPVTLGPDGRLLKEGFLTKRGKNFGGWKARYFVLDEPVLRYYESPSGSLLGTIRLQNARIGRQSQHSQSPSRTGEDGDSQYRHAFLILETKRNSPNSHVKHVLCAESDAERDVWVDALAHYVDSQPANARGSVGSTDSSSNRLVKKSHAKGQDAAIESPESETFNELRGVNYETTVPAQKPVVQVIPEQRPTDSPSPTASSIQSATRAQGSQITKNISGPSNGVKIEDAWSWGASKAISGPSNGVKIEDAGAWGNRPQVAPPGPSKEHRKRSNFWGFRDRQPSDANTNQSNESGLSLPQPQNTERAANVRAVFGMPIAEAVEYWPPKGMPDICLPAVVYRCLEYLEAQDAANEEGIFRLSGSSVVIKNLRDRFNHEGDFDILADEQYFDVHAVASLLKLYLRELPSTILTRELHLEFLKVLGKLLRFALLSATRLIFPAFSDLDEKAKKIAAYNLLVHRLPRANWALIRALSAFLISIVNNSDVNKMSVRNVGIVFSPTLNIPAPVFAMFLTDFDAVFGEEPDDTNVTPPEVSITEPLTPEDIRSPRRQMFSDIPTPSYTQDSFPHLLQQKIQQPSYEQFSQALHADHDTGMIPLQPSYETSTSFAPISNNAPQGPTARKQSGDSAAKARRRESSMLLMAGGLGGSGQRKSSMPLLRNNSGM